MKAINVKTLAIFTVVLVLATGAFFIGKERINPEVAGVKTQNTLPIRGVIIPHHDLAGELIDSTLRKVSDGNDYQTIIVLGTNHFNQESYIITTAEKVEDFSIDSDAVDNFISHFPETVVDQEILEKDHAATVPMNYLRIYFPDAKFVPLLISPFYTREELDKITDFLANSLPEDTLYVAAVDFAHEVTLKKGLENNKESIDAISTFNYPTILSFKEDYMDSAVAIALMLRLMEIRNAKNWETWENYHSALIVGDTTIQGTSYVLGVFR